jgi:hypothetical protein
VSFCSILNAFATMARNSRSQLLLPMIAVHAASIDHRDEMQRLRTYLALVVFVARSVVASSRAALAYIARVDNDVCRLVASGLEDESEDEETGTYYMSTLFSLPYARAAPALWNDAAVAHGQTGVM